MLQWLKNTVPDPRVPEIGGSSPWCTETAAIRATAPAPQNPVSPARRSTPHSRGHRRHDTSTERGDGIWYFLGAKGAAGASSQRPMERGGGCVERNGSSRSKVASVAERKAPASRCTESGSNAAGFFVCNIYSSSSPSRYRWNRPKR